MTNAEIEITKAHLDNYRNNRLYGPTDIRRKGGRLVRQLGRAFGRGWLAVTEDGRLWVASVYEVRTGELAISCHGAVLISELHEVARRAAERAAEVA